MTEKKQSRQSARTGHAVKIQELTVALFLAITTLFAALPQAADAQSYRFSSVSIEGNKRIEAGTILSYAGIARGETVSASQLNDAYQRILGSGLFESVTIEPRGSKLVIAVKEFPTINRIRFEGNRRLKDDDLEAFIESKPRLVFSPTKAERDAETLAEAYNQNARIGARINPKIIRRSDNRVDLVFEIFEGGVTEIERIGFVGNRAYSDRRLRRVLETKQAGLLRALIKKDSYVEDRLQFDQQVLRDFYLSRGYVDFRTTGVNAELMRERDGYLLTFNVEEGQQFRFGEITTTSDMDAADADEFHSILKVRPGVVYSPSLVENSIARMERYAIKKGIDFLRVEPRITRNDRDLTLDVEFILTKGPRIFVERIDIEGNATTLDRVVRRQFKIVEGDPFNPREIRESAERIRALGYFGKADVNAREGSSPDQVVVDVDVEETTTGSLSFGGSYSTDDGFGLAVEFTETNFLGRGQQLNMGISGAGDKQSYNFDFVEPAFLGRDVALHFNLGYAVTDSTLSAPYDTQRGYLGFGLEFPISENARVGLNYKLDHSQMRNYVGSGPTFPAPPLPAPQPSILATEAQLGYRTSSSIGYSFSYDTRRGGLNPNAGYFVDFTQDFGGMGGDVQFVKSTAKLIAQTKVLNEEVTLRATFAAGMLNHRGGTASRAIDRFLYGNNIMRGFDADGIGPRQCDTAGCVGATYNEALGGNYYATAQFEAIFPLGLPEEYGLQGGVFYDIGSVWGLDRTAAPGTFVVNGGARQVLGLSLFWKTPVGPLRMNWSKPLKKQAWDQEQLFELTISTEF
ncbi:outer membrane protein assembly factor BamA [Alisedimentitalea sp. MJ-SS2]|uniref:outer membrane protein assembly factor BamA n=1 Tax=Aliisedimentitalea sp. MJ-SS2 TaxID=3049795 RepID=UPI00290D4FBB|nr:outer membrane protein assembly factor BamA [Alisedimentitalea sp. MJ-SS2]MDU8929770.1 outer membrane protein assembly factor BamA [Alisedimentitalea sp. MJ-SS2]